LRQYGWSSKYKVENAGGRNSRLDEIQAAILNDFLPLLDGWNEQRRQIAKKYFEGIRVGGIKCINSFSKNYVAHLFVIRFNNRDALLAHLKKNNIFSEVHYPILDYMQPSIKDNYRDTFLENSVELSSEVLTLPCYPEMKDSDVSHVIKVVNGFFHD
jgi:dTDP-4-amino-4,6-dideoxygalactose transaminase